MFVVVVTFHIKSEAVDQFVPLMKQNAEISLREEPLCFQFDVCESESVRNMIFLYEVYDSQAAFDAHLATDHFREFDKAVAPMIETKHVQTFKRIVP